MIVEMLPVHLASVTLCYFICLGKDIEPGIRYNNEVVKLRFRSTELYKHKCAPLQQKLCELRGSILLVTHEYIVYK